MIRSVFTILSLVFTTSMSAQIDMSDSTVQVITHWNMDEEQTYRVTDSRSLVVAGDTSELTKTSYNVNIKVVDSTSVGYIIEWTRNNFTFAPAGGFENQIESIMEGFPILLRMDEYGSNVEVLNWEDAKYHVNTTVDLLKEEYKDLSNRLVTLNQFKRKHNSKSAIEENAIRDVQQFFAYHGAKYKLGETIKAHVKVPNNYGGDDLDTDAVMLLDNILPENNTFIIKSFQNVNPQQLTAVTYDYLSRQNLEGADLPAYEDFPTILKQIWGGSEIHGPSGWVIFSQESEQITSGEDITTSERLIEILQ